MTSATPTGITNIQAGNTTPGRIARPNPYLIPIENAAPMRIQAAASQRAAKDEWFPVGGASQVLGIEPLGGVHSGENQPDSGYNQERIPPRQRAQHCSRAKNCGRLFDWQLAVNDHGGDETTKLTSSSDISGPPYHFGFGMRAPNTGYQIQWGRVTVSPRRDPQSDG